MCPYKIDYYYTRARANSFCSFLLFFPIWLVFVCVFGRLHFRANFFSRANQTPLDFMHIRDILVKRNENAKRAHISKQNKIKPKKRKNNRTTTHNKFCAAHRCDVMWWCGYGKWFIVRIEWSNQLKFGRFLCN